MTPFEEAVLFDCLHRAQAYEAVSDPKVGGEMDAEGLYDLCVAAGFSTAAAEKAARERGLQRLRKGLPA